LLTGLAHTAVLSDLPIDPDLPADTRGGEPPVLAAIAVGGFIGALGRYELGLAWPTPPGHVPWSTFAINESGAFLLGLVLTVLVRQGRHNHVFRPFFCVGVLGAWTTMSTFAVETDLLVWDGHAGVAVLYTVATVVFGVGVAWLGVVAGRWVSR
jgi:CrcB protein